MTDPALETIRQKVRELRQAGDGLVFTKPIEQYLRLDPREVSSNTDLRGAVASASQDLERLTRSTKEEMYLALASALRSGDYFLERDGVPPPALAQLQLYKQSAGDFVYSRINGLAPGEMRLVVLSIRKGNAERYFAARQKLLSARDRIIRNILEIDNRPK